MLYEFDELLTLKIKQFTLTKSNVNYCIKQLQVFKKHIET